MSTAKTTHPLANSPYFVRITRAEWEAEQAERYKFAFTPELKPLRSRRSIGTGFRRGQE